MTLKGVRWSRKMATEKTIVSTWLGLGLGLEG